MLSEALGLPVDRGNTTLRDMNSPSHDPVHRILARSELSRFTADVRQVIERALRSVMSDFDGVMRKSPPNGGVAALPFSAHLVEVALLIAEHGGDAEAVVAGLLHDNIEDLPQQWSKSRIAAEFSPRIADLVDWVTQQDKQLAWEVRNERYLERLRSAPDEACMISCADKISNMRGFNDLMRQGYSVASIAKRGWGENSRKFHGLRELFERRSLTAGLRELYSETLAEFDRLGNELSLH